MTHEIRLLPNCYCEEKLVKSAISFILSSMEKFNSGHYIVTLSSKSMECENVEIKILLSALRVVEYRAFPHSFAEILPLYFSLD